LSAGGNQAQIAVAVSRPWSGDLVLLLDGQERWRQGASLVPGQPYRGMVDLANLPQTGRLTFRLETKDGVVTAQYNAELGLQ
jgi:transposase